MAFVPELSIAIDGAASSAPGRGLANAGRRKRSEPAATPVRLAEVAHSIADPGRARILSTLMDGRVQTAGELASVAGVTPQTMSSHLSKLLACGLLAVEKHGRRRLYRLTGPRIARMLASMMLVAGKDARGGAAGSRNH
jgi:DNA-binding transcriptional ArsR family regulator